MFGLTLTLIGRHYVFARKMSCNDFLFDWLKYLRHQADASSGVCCRHDLRNFLPNIHF